MNTGDVGPFMAAVSIPPVRTLRRWPLWTLRRHLIVYVIVVDAAALTATGFMAAVARVSLRDGLLLAGLVVAGVFQAELGHRVERIRSSVKNSPHVNMTSVWTFAGVLVLPSALVAALVTALYIHLAVRDRYRLWRVPAFRAGFNVSLVILTCYAAQVALTIAGAEGMHDVLDGGRSGVGAVVAAVVVYFIVGALFAVPNLDSKPRSWRAIFGSWSDNLLEVATICLGVLVALTMVTLPFLTLAVAPPLYLLHRGILMRQLEVAATTDEKTGLLNNLGWHHLAAHVLMRAKRKEHSGFGILMIDLDYFKSINDRYGHLSGDSVLRSVASTITGAVRDYDAVGRFGGEEFVVLMPDVVEVDVTAVAERIRKAIAQLEVGVETENGATVIGDISASIGVATYPVAGVTVESLLQAADRALYEAKNTGRNKVVCALNTA